MNIHSDTTLDELLRERRAATLVEPPLGRLLRQGVGLSQDDVADLLNVDRSTLSRWESGKGRPRRQHVAAYLTVLRRFAAELQENGRVGSRGVAP